MRYLKEHAEKYSYAFTDSLIDADVVITNDVFTDEALQSSKPLVKRMCAPYWQYKFHSRNIPLNEAARQANVVIFITEYSRKEYEHTNQKLENNCVVPHWVDPNVFKNLKVQKRERYTFAACATDWSRAEKRFYEITLVAQMFPQDDFLFIGHLRDDQLALMPKNCISIGYIEEPRMIAKALNSCHAFINLSYRDAATKTVPQAVACGLPVVYADSGGVREMTRGNGIAIEDKWHHGSAESAPSLDSQKVITAITHCKSFHSTLLASHVYSRVLFRGMLDDYFFAINEAIEVCHGRR